MITHIDHINISVTDLEKSTSFFVDLLDFKVLEKAPLSGKWLDDVVGLNDVDATYVQLELPGSKTKLELIEYHHPKGEINPHNNKSNAIGYRHIALAVSDIESVIERLKKADVRLFSEIQDYTTKRLIYFEGPDGIIVELAAYK